LDKSCLYCNKIPYGDTRNIGTQRFNNKAVSNIKLNPCDTSLLTALTWNVPNVGANSYTVTTRINYCPMCGRKLVEAS